MKNKKAVSPLIATVLLVSFSIALGAVVMNWGEELVVNQANDVTQRTDRSVKCTIDASIKVLEINNQKFICYNRSNSNNLEVIVENEGTINLDGVQVFLLDLNDNPYTYNVITPLGAHNRTKYNVSLDAGFIFPPTKVIVSPVLSFSNSGADVCANNRIDVENIEECT